MVPVPSLNLVYTEEKDYVTAEQAKEEGLKEKKLSGTAFRKVRSRGCMCSSVVLDRLWSRFLP